MTKRYFQLNPDSLDKEFARASRMALRTFAQTIKYSDEELALELHGWADSISPRLEDNRACMEVGEDEKV